jgi:Zn-dependent membrane protease YugP
MIYFDFWYLIFLAPAIVLGIYAQWKVMSAYSHASRLRTRAGLTGAETAATILRAADVRGVRIEDTPGQLTDHYDPSAKALRLSPDVFEGNSIASVGIAAHEVGHAIQDDRRYPLLVIRNAIVPLAKFGSTAGIILLILGLVLAMSGLLWIGIAVFSLTVFFQLVNLPVEFDASRRARKMLLSTGMIMEDEEPEVARVLNAAALTYVAATLTSILTLLYYVTRASGMGRSDD